MLSLAAEPDSAYTAWFIEREKRRLRNGGSPVTEQCGNMSGYRAHQKKNEPPCPECAYAYENSPQRPSAKCGTLAGWKRHHREGEPKCARCTAAMNEYNRSRSRKAGRKPRPVLKCGTAGGAKAHYRAGEPVCDPCRDALNAERTEKRQPKNF